MGPTVTDTGSTGRQLDPSYQSNQVSVPNMDDTFGCKSGPDISCDISQYIPSGKEDSVEHVLWALEVAQYLSTEVSAGSAIGPFHSPPHSPQGRNSHPSTPGTKRAQKKNV